MMAEMTDIAKLFYALSLRKEMLLEEISKVGLDLGSFN